MAHFLELNNREPVNIEHIAFVRDDRHRPGHCKIVMVHGEPIAVETSASDVRSQIRAVGAA